MTAPDLLEELRAENVVLRTALNQACADGWGERSSAAAAASFEREARALLAASGMGQRPAIRCSGCDAEILGGPGGWYNPDDGRENCPGTTPTGFHEPPPDAGTGTPSDDGRGSLHDLLVASARSRLAERGWSQVDLSAATGFTQKHISQVMQGHVPGTLTFWDTVAAHVGPLAAPTPPDAGTGDESIPGLPAGDGPVVVDRDAYVDLVRAVRSLDRDALDHAAVTLVSRVAAGTGTPSDDPGDGLLAAARACDEAMGTDTADRLLDSYRASPAYALGQREAAGAPSGDGRDWLRSLPEWKALDEFNPHRTNQEGWAYFAAKFVDAVRRHLAAAPSGTTGATTGGES